MNQKYKHFVNMQAERENNLSERLLFLITSLGLNANSFSKTLGYTNNNVTIGKILQAERNPSYETLSKIKQTFREVNLNWLLFGEGDMYVNDPSSFTLNEPPSTYKVNSLQKLNIDEKEYYSLLEKVKMLEQINELQKKIIEHYESGDTFASKIG